MADRKEICQALTGVVKRSPLKNEIDAKAFFMMVNTNFALICQNNTLELELVWSALSAKHDAERLYGLFLKFEDAVDPLGVGVVLPSALNLLSSEERQTHRQEFDGVVAELPMEAIVSMVDEDKKADILAAFAQSIRSSPAGQFVQIAQLQFWLDGRFYDICNAERFNFQPVLDLLLGVDGVSETHVYPAIIRLRDALEPGGILVEDPPTLTLDQQVRNRIAQDTRAAPKEVYSVVEIKQQQKERTSVPPPPPQPDKPTTATTRRAEQLKRHGLSGAPKKKVRAWNLIMQGIVAVCIGVVFYLSSPMKDLGLEEWGQFVPLKSAAVYDGTFFGVLDLERWNKLSVNQRQKALVGLGDKLKKKELWKAAAVVNTKGHLIIWPGTDDKLHTTSELMSPPKK